MSLALFPNLPADPKPRTYGHLRLIGGKWVLTHLEPHVAIRLKSVFPRLPKTETRAFQFRDTAEACSELEWFLQRYPMRIAPEDVRALRRGKRRFERVLDEVERILLPDWTPPNATGFRDGLAPYPFQAQAIAVARHRRRLLLGDDVGLGKTITALGAIADKAYLPAAIIVQAHLPAQWKRFVERFTTLRTHIITGTVPYSLPEADVYIFRYSNIAGWVDIAERGPFRSVIFDEIQELRTGPRTEKGKAGTVFSRAASALRMGLSATPIYNFGDEIFAILELIEPGALGLRSEFIREYCVPRGIGKWAVGDPDALGTYLREQHLMLRRLRAGGPVNTIVREIAYDQSVADEAEDLARTLALKVIRGAFVERGQAARELDILARLVTGLAKARQVAAFVRVLLDAGTPVLLAGWHREVYAIWLEELKACAPVMYTGSESPAAKERSKAKFVGGETDLMIISLRSGVGLDGLQHRCATVVFGELDWSPKVHEQVIGRLDRPGQESEVTSIYLHADDGSDPVMLGLLGVKASQSKGIMDPLAEAQPVHSDDSRLRILAQRYLDKPSSAQPQKATA